MYELYNPLVIGGYYQHKTDRDVADSDRDITHLNHQWIFTQALISEEEKTTIVPVDFPTYDGTLMPQHRRSTQEWFNDVPRCSTILYHRIPTQVL
jgi:hypothetical protein